MPATGGGQKLPWIAGLILAALAMLGILFAWPGCPGP
jgi:hypothetical protein